MRYFILVLLFLFSLNASALEVVASGFGKDYNEALTNAKMVALDNVNGAWIHGDSYVRNGMFSEKITQYNGGVITRYEVLKKENTFVIIKANVEPRSNKMKSNSANVSALQGALAGHQDEYNRKQQAVKAIDKKSQALAVEINEVRYENAGKLTNVTMVVTIGFQDKWVADYSDLKKMAGEIELTCFYTPLRLVVEGRDGEKVMTSNMVRLPDNDVNLYLVSGNRTKINMYDTEKYKLTFLVDSGKLTSVNDFVITFKD